MAVLTDAQRREVWVEFMRVNDEPIALTKVDLRAAVDATDSWIDANAASYNAALPQPARGVLTTAQKSRLYSIVSRKRYGG